ncbi:MAG: hypothetical protein ACYTXT_19900 [Nostoc sp.]
MACLISIGYPSRCPRNKIPIVPVTERPLNLATRLPADSSMQTVWIFSLSASWITEASPKSKELSKNGEILFKGICDFCSQSASSNSLTANPLAPPASIY